ncbi:MAG: hypothetical protein WD175_02350 [Candidatus Paceibacterota bacterium]
MTEDHAQRRHKEVGFVEEVKHYLVYIRGLPTVRVNDLLVDESGRRAIVGSILENRVEALMLDKVPFSVGDRLWVAKEKAQVRIGSHLFGSVCDGLGNLVSHQQTDASQAPSVTDEESVVSFTHDVRARDIDERDFIKEQLHTGFSAIDLLVPIGKGQRELIFGPIDSGKDEFLREVVSSQKGKDIVCIYAVVGKPAGFTEQLVREFTASGALAHTIIISAPSTDAAPSITVAPSTAFLFAEHFVAQGKDVLLILNDLGIHAQYLREVALLSGRVPGRESYPGDMFYQHAHLMERAGRFNKAAGGGSITLFPVMELNRESAQNLIPTNLMASTDGHLMFSADVQAEGALPAVAVIESITRIGHHTQSSLTRELSTRLMGIVSEYPRQQEYSRFGTTLSERTKRVLTQGSLIQILLNQKWVGPLDETMQIMLCTLPLTSMSDDQKSPQNVRVYREDIMEILREDDVFKEAREGATADMPFKEFLELMEQNVSAVTSLWQTSKTTKQN